MTLRTLGAALAAAAGVALLVLAFWGYGAIGSVWLVQALPWCS